VVAAHDVERRVREGQLLGGAVHERHPVAHVGTRELELLGGVVDAGHARALADEREPELAGAAAELQHLAAVQLAERVELGLGDLPHPPVRRVVLDRAGIPRLVRLGGGIPALAVLACVVGQLHDASH
jgi:hypothetical protein